MELLNLLYELEELIENGRRVPGTGKSMVERAALGALLDQLRASVPEEFQDAYQIRARGESIVTGAVTMAKKIRAEAEKEHQARVDENSIVTDAEERAQQIRAEAERDAERVRQRVNAEAANRIQEADAYASHSLERLAGHLAVVREHMGELEQEMSEVERAVDTGTRYLQARQTGSGGAAAAGEPQKDRRRSGSGDLNWDAVLEPETNGAQANGAAGAH